uniref:Aminotransferase class I/classII large domain-containing protein n=1 Tax=Aegilops tauschii subsp. strangulata TaxID=200361 RepID=A0A452YVZ6_AEGTS
IPSDTFLQSFLVIDFVVIFLEQAHGTLVCGDNGGGVPELLECESGIDISVGTLSKAAGCQGGFVACRHPVEEFNSVARSFVHFFNCFASASSCFCSSGAPCLKEGTMAEIIGLEACAVFCILD